MNRRNDNFIEDLIAVLLISGMIISTSYLVFASVLAVL